MSTLFSLEPEADSIPPIPGLSYIPDYVTTAAEASLVLAIDREPWDTSWERRRQPYGASYGKPAGERRAIPPWGMQFAERMRRDKISDRLFDQMLINEYMPGQGIALHRDYEPFDRTIVSLSLLSPVVMDFRRVSDGQRESLLLAPRSLLVLSDAARYEWEHGIARRKSDRWHGERLLRSRRLSVTFRMLKQNA